MRFAVPLANGVLCGHFGHCQQFVIVDAQDGRISAMTCHTSPPHEPGALPRWLGELGVNVVIAGGMGRRALGLFNERGIQVMVGATSAAPEELVADYLAGILRVGHNLCDH
jgi:ATP-binding protein involved in chromosome partitioning